MLDRLEQSEGRFRAPLLNWLAELPAGGWEGTSHQSGDALFAFGERWKLVAFVPTCPGRKVAELSAFLSDNGFTLTHSRTKRTRTG